MNCDFNERKLTAFLADLSREEKAWLLRELLADYWKQPASKKEDELLAAERWFMDRARNSGPGQREGREKFWLIFLCLRYAGLRMAEITALSSAAFNLREGLLHIKGQFKRIIPFPLPVAERIRATAQHSPIFRPGYPLGCDDSQLRKIFRRCADETEIDRSLLTIHSLRKHRALELQKSGIHPQLVKIFFYGAQGQTTFFHDPEEILIRQIQKETRMEKMLKTSARNVFQGPIVSIRHEGLLADVKIETGSGLEIRSIITKTSLENLGLEKGKQVKALVKAPWVRLTPAGEKPAHHADMNLYEGEVEKVNADERATEILLKLKKGEQLCAVYAGGEKPPVSFKAGDAVTVCISAFAVVLVTA